MIVSLCLIQENVQIIIFAVKILKAGFYPDLTRRAATDVPLIAGSRHLMTLVVRASDNWVRVVLHVDPILNYYQI